MDDPNGLTSAIHELKTVVEQLRADLVRKDVYMAERETDRAEVKSLRDAVTEIKGTLSWLSRSLVVSILMPIISGALIIYVLRQGR